MTVRTTAVAIFEDRTDVQRAIDELRRAGFTDKEIGVTARDGVEADSSAVDTAKGETHAKEGAVAGVAAGAGVGALWGLGILAGVLPAIGPAIAGGTLAAILSSAAAGAATAGLAGTLIGLGIPEDEANYYDREFRAGRTVVTVRAEDRLDEVQAILRHHGGRDMRSSFDDATPEPMPGMAGRASSAVAGLRHSVDAPVRKEELVIERHAVGRHPASGRTPLSEGQVEVEKTSVVTEGVPVGKRANQEEEHVDTTVRKENIKVDKRGRRDTRSDPR